MTCMKLLIQSILIYVDMNVCKLPGIQTRTVKCVRKDDESNVNVALCEKNSAMPPKENACNTQHCKPV